MFITKKKHEKIIEEKLQEQRNEFLTIYWAVDKVLDRMQKNIDMVDERKMGNFKCVTSFKVYIPEIKAFTSKI
jgi:hypothetical protein